MVKTINNSKDPMRVKNKL